jgi:hypothetical protein
LGVWTGLIQFTLFLMGKFNSTVEQLESRTVSWNGLCSKFEVPLYFKFNFKYVLEICYISHSDMHISLRHYNKIFIYTGYKQKNGAISLYSPLKPHHSFVYTVYILVLYAYIYIHLTIHIQYLLYIAVWRSNSTFAGTCNQLNQTRTVLGASRWLVHCSHQESSSTLKLQLAICTSTLQFLGFEGRP